MTTRICTGCGLEQDETEFRYRDRKRGKRHSSCAACWRQYQNAHYHANPWRKELVRKDAARSVNRNRDIIIKYFAENPCIDCGESDPVVLDFDHKDNTKKVHNVSYMAKAAFSVERLLLEIKKCDIRCANCHRRRTAKQFKWWSCSKVV